MLIIDTDPGVDDALAILLSLSLQDKVALRLITVTYGNCSLKNAIHNLRSLFHVWQQEVSLRQQADQNYIKTHQTEKPLIAAGSICSLDKKFLPADNVHGSDGLGGVHSHPEAREFYLETVESLQEWTETIVNNDLDKDLPYNVSKLPAHEEILNVLRNNKPNSVNICAIGPLTNLARALENDPQTFSRVRKVIVMGGAVNIPGNISPFAEFNFYCDPLAAAYLLAHTSSNPKYTSPNSKHISVSPVVSKSGWKPIDLRLFPLDITLQHNLFKGVFEESISHAMVTGILSPMARWMKIWLESTFKAMSALDSTLDGGHVNLHDPLAVFYAICDLCQEELPPEFTEWDFMPDLDLRVEYQGAYTNGMILQDHRVGRPRTDSQSIADPENWLYRDAGNSVKYCTKTPVLGETFGRYLMSQIFHP